MSKLVQLGDKILRRREELHLSQKQVAGTEISRSFLSLVERNICKPSAATLQVIAARLQKPVEYFTDGTLPLAVETSLHLVSCAEQALQEQSLDVALRHASLAARHCALLDEPRTEARAYQVIATCHERLGQIEQAAESLERYAELCAQISDKGELCWAYIRLGTCAYKIEDFKSAERQYRRALSLAAGLKSLIEQYNTAMVYLGSCMVRLGRHDDALSHYQPALSEIDPRATPWLWAMTALSLGWVSHKLGQHEEAVRVSVAAREMLAQLNHPDRVQAEHNLAIFEMDRGDLTTALRSLQQCRAAYHALGEPEKEHSVTEDIAKCHVGLGDLVQARTECEHALRLLDGQRSSLLRGRLYLLLAQIRKLEGNSDQVQPLAEVAAAIFRQLRAAGELQHALQLIGPAQPPPVTNDSVS